ncbi:hypothetical protein DFA_02367 [Cavenderia fasciculata]|uniref:Uncharacterized protein n=1 Tax=Cavenderia fasciculata TaxID=261658 RepID=F4PZ91_CACFS|nr:uncharacterized protein DFA_02367 [Cavenderia fasciculata]EGG19120.1 hypothetical protein DFA_02367 [Cavenderia fasciculata]|eukprot:XP_004366753.1 hypothetical protein DFA_02367 [Cavenderia fasciculata]
MNQEEEEYMIDKEELDEFYHHSDNIDKSYDQEDDFVDFHDMDEDDEDDIEEKVYYFDSLAQLSTKQSRWVMFFSMFVPNEDHDWKLPHIQSTSQEEEKAEFIKLVWKKFGWVFIMNYGTLEYVKLAHSLRLVDPQETFYPKHKDCNQTIAIMKHLHNTGIHSFTDDL